MAALSTHVLIAHPTPTGRPLGSALCPPHAVLLSVCCRGARGPERLRVASRQRLLSSSRATALRCAAPGAAPGRFRRRRRRAARLSTLRPPAALTRLRREGLLVRVRACVLFVRLPLARLLAHRTRARNGRACARWRLHGGRGGRGRRSGWRRRRRRARRARQLARRRGSRHDARRQRGRRRRARWRRSGGSGHLGRAARRGRPQRRPGGHARQANALGLRPMPHPPLHRHSTPMDPMAIALTP